MQLIQTNDKAKRQSYRDALQHKVEAALNTPPPSAPIVPDQILLLPHNYEEFNATDLHYNLMHNPELKHSRQSANLAVDLVFGKYVKPENVSFQSVELKNPVKIPEFSEPKHVKGAAKPALAPDSKAIKLAAEDDKKKQFKKALADKAEKAFNAKPEGKTVPEIVRLVPQGYDTMSAGELHFALLRNPEFKSGVDQTAATVEQVTGRTRTPENVRFQVLEVENIKLAPPVAPIRVKNPPVFKPATKAAMLARAEIRVGTPAAGETAILIPHNFEEMTETQIHFALSHNREYGHSHESVYEALDMMFGRKAQPKGVVFSLIQVENPIERAY